MDARDPHRPALTDAQIEAVVAGIAAGGGDTTDVRRLRAAVGVMRDGAIEAAPERLVARLVGLEGQARLGAALDRVADAVTGGVMGAVRAIVATLAYDSRVSPALAGFRGTSGAVQLVFASEVGEIHLHVTESAAGDGVVTVRGVIEAGDAESVSAAGGAVDGVAAGVFVLTRESDGTPTSAEIDEDGMFTARVSPGLYRGTLSMGPTCIDLGTLELP